MFPGMLPRRNNKYHFEKGDLRENFNALSVFRNLSYKINNKALLLVPDRFRKQSDLYNLLDQSDALKYKGADKWSNCHSFVSWN